MNDVRDLNQTNHTQTISLSAVNGTSLNNNQNNQSSNKVSINSVGSLTGVSENNENADRPTIRINPNMNKKPRRSVTANEAAAMEVNPNDFIERKVEPKGVTLQQSAVDKLDAAINRKQREFRDFIDAATKADEINREKVEAGLEEIQGEVKYIPDEVEKANEVKEQPKRKAPAAKKKTYDEDDIDSEIEDDINDEFDEAPDTYVEATYSNVEISREDPFATKKVEPKEDSYMKETIETPVVEESFEDDDFVEEEAVYEEEEVSTPVAQQPVKEEETVAEEPKKVEAPAPKKVKDTVAATKEAEDKAKKMDDLITNTITSGSIHVVSQVAEIPGTKEALQNSTADNFNIDAEDLDDVTYDGDDNEEQLSDEELKRISIESDTHLKNEILQKVINAGKKLDTSSFVISNKVISIRDAMKNKEAEPVRTGSWPLTYAGRPFIATALKGPEVALLADSDEANGVGLTQPQVKILYDHDANPYKPQTIEAWAKTIPFADVDNIFAALYVASLKGANYMPISCPKPSCQYAYLTDDTDINTMVKFANDDVKKRFEEVKTVQLTADNAGAYKSVVSVINDKFAIGLKLPSIYTILYEYNSLNTAFIRKYTTIVAIIQYIDYIYKINPETNSFEPIGWKVYPGENGKTFKSKIATYAKILSELDGTDFSILTALINSMIVKMSETNGLTYEIPASKCPKCGTEIAAREISPRYLVFMRQRLVELATMPTEK